MQTRCWRVHPGDEAIETVLNPGRKDGWVASDEDGASQPRGVSVCLDLDDLRRYIRMYSLSIQPRCIAERDRVYEQILELESADAE